MLIKKVVAYLSMGFGNLRRSLGRRNCGRWTEKLSKMGVKFCLFPILSAIRLDVISCLFSIWFHNTWNWVWSAFTYHAR
jgi:hypothetical protein